MSDKVEIVSDGEGALVLGSRKAVRRFLKQHGLANAADSFNLERLNKVLGVGSDLLESVSNIAEQSAMYLKLTPESAQRLRDSGGLMPTKTKGISHAMLGKTGDRSMKWLQVDTKASSLISNPRMLAGVAGLMSQVAHQTEAQEFREFLVRIEGKLDDVRRSQRNAVIAQMQSAAGQIKEAQNLREKGGDPRTLWDKVQGAHSTISNVQEEALLALEDLVEKAQAEEKPRAIKKTTREIEQEVALHLAVLARCFELEDQFRIIELDHVMATAPDYLEGHRQGLMKNREQRRGKILGRTRPLMHQLDRCGAVANENIILHSRQAQAIIASLNSTAETIREFHESLGVTVERDNIAAVTRSEAWRDPNQRKVARKEAGQKILVVGAGAALGGLGSAVVKLVKNRN
ncbi:hypothetical protein [Corynebacterium sp. UMB10321]|uniref:hypothetical protein n=1 Tax=Corynebacterium sp. UMB10321 TaxID=3046312 RepID=UPI00254D7DC5|nr:hypothetical protein [Corynebacterium sp. UMB10321]MDK8243475.1 hypothetical protein [Corynebacterium sp. UMB10321]